MSLQLPVSGWPSQVLPTLWRYLFEIVSNDGLLGFKIGRSIDVEERFSEHVRQHTENPPVGYVVLYQTSSLKHAKEVEEELIRQFIYHPLCRNDIPYSAGGESSLYFQYVYVLVWV